MTAIISYYRLGNERNQYGYPVRHTADFNDVIEALKGTFPEFDEATCEVLPDSTPHELRCEVPGTLSVSAMHGVLSEMVQTLYAKHEGCAFVTFWEDDDPEHYEYSVGLPVLVRLGMGEFTDQDAREFLKGWEHEYIHGRGLDPRSVIQVMGMTEEQYQAFLRREDWD